MQQPPSNLPDRWLVTGGCGFVGAALVERLVGAGVPSIRVVDHLQYGSEDALPNGMWREVFLPDVSASWPAGLELIRASVEDRKALRRCVEGADVVVHLASGPGSEASLEDPFRDLESNVVGTVSVLDAARRTGVARVVLVSTADLMGGSDPEVPHARPNTPRTPYAAGKVACEAYALAYAHAFGLDPVILRFGHIYGPRPGAERSVVAALLERSLEGQAPLLADGPSTHLPDFLYVDDAVDALISAASAPGVAGRTILAANEPGITVGEVVQVLENVTRRLDITQPDPAARTSDLPASRFDTGPARELLAWTPSTSLEQGLEATVPWLLAYWEKQKKDGERAQSVA